MRKYSASKPKQSLPPVSSSKSSAYSLVVFLVVFLVVLMKFDDKHSKLGITVCAERVKPFKTQVAALRVNSRVYNGGDFDLITFRLLNFLRLGTVDELDTSDMNCWHLLVSRRAAF